MADPATCTASPASPPTPASVTDLQTLSPPPPPQPPAAVLPGSRWLQRSASGHGTQTNSVIRVGEYSVTFVMEGGGKGGGSHKSGRKYTVPLEAFLNNHTLLSQPPGYKPGDERLPDRPKTDTLQHYFDRRARAKRLQDTVEGRDIRLEVSGEHGLPVPPRPSPTAFEGVLVAVLLPEPVEETEEPPVTSSPATPETPSVPHAARHESVANPVLPPRQAERAQQLLAQSAEVQPAPELPTPVLAQFADTPASPTTLETEATEATEADPMEQFMESGRVLVEGLNARLAAAQRLVDQLVAQADAAQTHVDHLTAQRDRIEAAVLAAIEATGEPAPAPLLDPEPEPGEVRTVATVAGTARLMGPGGFVADPAKGTQRDWVLNRFDQYGGLVIQDVCDEFARHFGMSRERGIKAISSIMGRQIQNPNRRWSHAERTSHGVYKVAP